MTETQVFQPNWASPPGETVKELMGSMAADANHVAESIGLSNNEFRMLISGSLKIDQNLAQSLVRVFGASLEFWLARETQYQADIQRLQKHAPSEDVKNWITQLPLADMVRFGWIAKQNTIAKKVESALKFFGVDSVAAWNNKYKSPLSVAAFRSTETFKTNPFSVATWLRQAQLLADNRDCEKWNPERLRSELGKLRKLTKLKDPNNFLPQLTRILANCGVVFVVARSPKGCRASGATQFLDSQTALLVVSFRYLSDDHFWFTLFHEIGHLLLHGKDILFLEDGSDVTEIEEKEANEFAAKILIPEGMKELLHTVPLQAKPLIKLAGKLGISPGVLVGQLQNRGILSPQKLNSLKRRYKWEKIDEFLLTL